MASIFSFMLMRIKACSSLLHFSGQGHTRIVRGHLFPTASLLSLEGQNPQKETIGKVGTEGENTLLTCINTAVLKCGGIMQTLILGMEKPLSDVKGWCVGGFAVTDRTGLMPLKTVGPTPVTSVWEHVWSETKERNAARRNLLISRGLMTAHLLLPPSLNSNLRDIVGPYRHTRNMGCPKPACRC